MSDERTVISDKVYEVADNAYHDFVDRGGPREVGKLTAHIVDALIESGELIPASEVKVILRDRADWVEECDELRAERDRLKAENVKLQRAVDEGGGVLEDGGTWEDRAKQAEAQLSALLDAVERHWENIVGMRSTEGEIAADCELYAVAAEIKRGDPQ